MAEGGLGSAGQDGGHRVRMPCGGVVPHGVNPAVKEEEATVSQPVVDLGRRVPGAAQLCPRDDAMLRGGEGGDRRVLT